MMAKLIRSLARGLEVLKSVKVHGPISLQEVCGETGLPKSTAKRILETLEAQGYVRKGLGDNRFRLSAQSEDLGRHLPFSDKMTEVAAPMLDRLCARVAWPSDVAVYSDGAMEIGETTRRRTPLIINRLATASRIHMPVSALGRAYLAFCPVSEKNRILDILKHSNNPYDRSARDTKRMEMILERTRENGYGSRQHGYSVTPPEPEFSVQLSSIAVPVLAADKVLACINIVWIVGALSEEQAVDSYLGLLQETAQDISESYCKRFENDT